MCSLGLDLLALSRLHLRWVLMTHGIRGLQPVSILPRSLILPFFPTTSDLFRDCREGYP